MLTLLQEITKWPDCTPNHAYALDEKGKCVGYKKVSGEEWEFFGKPRMFYKSRRKFKTIGKVKLSELQK